MNKNLHFGLPFQLNCWSTQLSKYKWSWMNCTISVKAFALPVFYKLNFYSQLRLSRISGDLTNHLRLKFELQFCTHCMFGIKGNEGWKYHDYTCIMHGVNEKGREKMGEFYDLFGPADKQGLKVNLIKSVRNHSWGHFDLGEWFNTCLVPLGL